MPAVRPSMETTISLGMWVASASMVTVLASTTTRVSSAASPWTWTGHLDADLLAPADQDQVDVLDGVLDRVALDLLGQRQLRVAVDVDREQGVGRTQREQGLVTRQRDVDRVGAVAVQDGGHLVGAADPAGCTLAELRTQFGGQLYLGHERTPQTMDIGDAPRENQLGPAEKNNGQPSRSRSCDPRRGNRHSLAQGDRREKCPEELGLAAEQAGHRAVLEDLLDAAGDQRGDRQHRQLLELVLRRDAQGVGDDDLLERGGA